MRVAVGNDSTCPSCRWQFNGLTSQITPADERDSDLLDGYATQNGDISKGDQREPVSKSSETHFDLLGMCFSLNGRIPRSVFWFAGIGTVVLFYFGGIAAASLFGKDSSATPLVFLLFVVMFFWSQLAISVKRFHDLGMSGFWFPLILIPGIGQLVQFFLLGLRRGERGENKYGPDPIELFK
jgi:uncharacterized membrane protein YhaH (DUF805 family)